MNYNYHTHTSLCNHATGEITEYIQNAIDGGIIHMGFSDHVPYPFDDEGCRGTRMLSSEALEYVAGIRRLRELYKNKIDIKIGFEMEYFPDKFPSMLEYVKNIGADIRVLKMDGWTRDMWYEDTGLIWLPPSPNISIRQYSDHRTKSRRR